jgi:hypothetical protein
MNRDQFHAKLAGYDADGLSKILWTLYWRGSASMRERIEAQLDLDAHARQQRQKAEPPSAAAVSEEVRQFVTLARSGAYLAGDRRVRPRSGPAGGSPYLEALDDAADRTSGTSRHRSRSTGRDREARARAGARGSSTRSSSRSSGSAAR